MRDNLSIITASPVGGLSVEAAIAARDVPALNTALRQDFLPNASTVPADLKAFNLNVA